MDQTRLLLISPTSPSRRAESSHRPRAPRVFRFSMLSSLSVAAAMPPEVETRILDEDVEPIDFDAQADLVGISCMTYNAPRAYEIADRFRALSKPVILGGLSPDTPPPRGDRACRQRMHRRCRACGHADHPGPAARADCSPSTWLSLASLAGLPRSASRPDAASRLYSASTPFKRRGAAIEAAPSAPWPRFTAPTSAPAQWLR